MTNQMKIKSKSLILISLSPKAKVITYQRWLDPLKKS